MYKYVMEGTQHCQFVRGNYLHEHLAKRPGQVVLEDIRQVGRMITRYLKDVPNSGLRFEKNQAFLLLLTLNGDPIWHYMVDELPPQLESFVYRGGVVGVTGSLWGQV